MSTPAEETRPGDRYDRNSRFWRGDCLSPLKIEPLRIRRAFLALSGLAAAGTGFGLPRGRLG